MACLKPNFTSKNRISITISNDDNADSILSKILAKKWGFAITKTESESPDEWEDSIQLYVNAIERNLQTKGVSQNIINEIKEKVNIQLLSNDLEVEDSEDNAAEIPDAELDTSKQKEEIKLSVQLRNIFGDDKILQQKFFKQFKHDIYTRSIINIGKSVTTSKIIYDIHTLNKAIMDYQSQLHSIVYNFLKNNNILPEGQKVANLYNEEGEINSLYSKNMNAFQKYLDSQDNLQKLVATKTYSGDTELIEAVNAFLSLQYFDKLMLKSVGKYLYINTKQNQPIVINDDSTKYKYSINRKNVNLASGWQNEIRDGIEEIGSFSQLIIEQIPIIDSDNYLDKVSLVSAFLKLRYALNQLGDSDNSPNRIALRNALKDLNKNTVTAWKEILTILDNSKVDGNLRKALIRASASHDKDKMSLTDSDFIVFDSVFDYFFNKQNGVYHIERANEFKGGRSTYGLTECLFATLNSTVQANYLEFRLVKGNPTLQQKAPWNSRQRMFQLRKSINEKVFRDIDTEFLNNFNILNSGNVIYDNFEIDVSTRKNLGIFNANLSELKVKKNGKIIKLDEYFREELQNIYSEDGRKEILSEEYEDNSEFVSLLKEIDNKLGTHFFSSDGLQVLRIFTELHDNPLQNLYLTAARVAGAYYINNNFKNAQDLDSTLTNFDLLKWLKGYNPTPYPGIKLLDKTSPLIYKYEGGLFISGIDNSNTVIEKISDAEAVFQGDNNKSVTKNLEGNNQPNISVAFTDIVQEFKDQDDSIASSNLLFAGNGSNLIVDTLIDTDVETSNGVKMVDQFTNSELLYHFLVNKFIYGTQQMGLFISQPVTYSDKKKFINFAVSWKDISFYKNGNKKYKNPYQIPKEAHIQAIRETQGEYYKSIFHKVADDYRIIFGISNENDQEVFDIAYKKMQKETKESFIDKAYNAKVNVFEDLHYRTGKRGLTPNETLYNYNVNIFPNLEQFLDSEKISYLNQLLDNYVIISADKVVVDALNQALENTGISSSDWIEEGLLVLAKYEGKNIVAGEQIPEDADVILNPLIESYFYLHNVIDNNIKLGISGHELHHKIKKLPSTLKEFNTFINKLGLKKTVSNHFEAENIFKTLSLENQEEGRKILNKSYYKAISLAHNAQFKRTVPIPGTIRPFDQGSLKGIPSIYNCAVVEDLKALTHDFLGNKGFSDAGSDVDAHDGSAWIDPFTSILENYSLDDSEGGEVKKPLWDVDEPNYGVRRLIKYASNAITNRIMLQSSKSTISMYNVFKKMTNHFKFDDVDLIDDWTITSGYAQDSSFTTNIINKENPLFYSHNGNYYQILNFGKDIINGEKVYYTIEDEVDENGNTLGNAAYKVYHYYDDATSNHIKVLENEEVPENVHTINSLFELHAAMGGIESMSKQDGTLIFSEASNRAVAHFMIYVSKPGPKYNNYIEGEGHYSKDAEISQDYFEQPLKTKLIHYIINQSAIKNGASNVNSVNTLSDNKPFKYDTYSTLKYGIQQDSDHTADEGKVTEMSQVISALDANGLYHDEVYEIYKVLGQQTIKAAQIELDAIKSNDRNKLYDIIGKTLVNNIQRDERGLTKAILYQIRKNFNLSTDHNLDKIKIPFSDPSIYGKILQTVGSILNKKSIKRKYPGMGQVMVPAFGIYQIWEINGNKYQYKDILKLAIQHNSESDSPIQDIGDPIEFNNTIVNKYLNETLPNEIVYNQQGVNDLYKIDPTNTLDISYRDSENKIKIATIKLDSLPDYYNFKENQLTFLQSKKYDAISIETIGINKKVPRDLAPTRVHFTYEFEEKQYTTNIYDTWPYIDMVAAMKRGDNETVEHYKKNIIPGFLARLEKGIMPVKTLDNKVVSANIIEMHNQPAETIMSNVYKSRLGIKDGDEMADITSPEYFEEGINKQLSNKLNGNIYDFDLQLITRTNEDNIYISLNSLSEDTENYQVKYQPWRTTNLYKEKVKDSKVVNRVYYLDNNNIKQFEIGRDIDVSNEIYYDKDTDSYKYISNDEVVTNRKIFREGDKVLEYIEFLIKQKIKPKNKNTFTKYTIDQNRLSKALLEKEKINNATTNIVNDLYHSDSFLIITPSKQIKKSNYNKVKTILTNLSQRNKNSDIGGYLRNILSNVFTHNSSTINGEGYINLESGNTVKLNREVETLGIDRGDLYGDKLISLLRNEAGKNKALVEPFKKLKESFNQSKLSYWENLFAKSISIKQFASFQKSKYFTSSRIPAQTLQSFMMMENVGFNGVDTNYCAVSHFQAFLQGSDYDIDKSYMMGLNFDNNGIYLGWSNLFNYNSLEEINISEELPMPVGRHYIFNQNFENADITINASDINNILSETDSKIRLHLVATLLRTLNKQLGNKKEVSIFVNDSEEVNMGIQDFLNEYLNKHEETNFGNNTDAILKNYISSNIQRIIQKLGNLADAYSPVEMKALQDMLDYTPKQENSTKLTLFNPAMVPIMQNTNMTGKQGTGVAANGQKALFMWRFGTLDTLLDPNKDSNMVTFNVTINRVLGRFKYNQDIKNNIPSQLNPVTIQSLPDLGNITNGLAVLSPKIKSDNIGSQYISAATDNAKELILSAINSGTKLMKCHLYLLSLGFDVEDIVSFMTSPAVSFIDSVADENIFNGTQVKINDAIDFAQKYLNSYISYNKATTLEEKEKIQKTLDSYTIKGIRGPIIKAFKNTLNKQTDLEGFLGDLISLKEIIKGADEFSAFGRILGINQGIPQTKEELTAWKNKLKFALISGSKNKNILNSKGEVIFDKPLRDYYSNLIPDIFTENHMLSKAKARINDKLKAMAIEYRGSDNIDDYMKKLDMEGIESILINDFKLRYGDVINFDTDRWLEDYNYRNKTSEYYNIAKNALNIFYLINTIPHFQKMFDIGNILNQVDKRISLKSQISNYYNKLLRDKYPYAPDKFETKLLSAIDEILIGHYIKSTGIKLNIKPNWKTLDSNYLEVKNSQILSLETDQDISSFKYIFEKYIIPELQNGTLLDNNEQNQFVKNNEFIKNLTITDERGVPLYKADINLLLVDNNEEVKRKYQTLLQGIKALKGIKYDNIPLIDLFMIYNMIVNKNRYGSERLTEIFEDFILDYDSNNLNSSYLVRYLTNLGNEDYSKRLLDKITSSVTLTDLLMKVAPLVSRKDSIRQEPFVKVLVPDKGYQFFEKTYRGYNGDPIDLLLEIPGESYNQKLQREITFTEYGFGLVYSQYVNEVINNLMSDNFENVLDRLIQNHTLFYEINCNE